MFHTGTKCDPIDQPQVSLFVGAKLHKGKENNMGFGRGWGVLKRSSSDRLQIAFLQGRIFYKELESLLCPQMVQNMKELPWNSMAFLHSYT